MNKEQGKSPSLLSRREFLKISVGSVGLIAGVAGPRFRDLFQFQDRAEVPESFSESPSNRLEQQRPIGAFVELPSVREFTGEERKWIEDLLIERFAWETEISDGRYLIALTGLNEEGVRVSRNSPFASYIEEMKKLQEEVRTIYGGETKALLLIHKEGGRIHQGAIVLQPTNAFSFGEERFDPSYESWIAKKADGGAIWFKADGLPNGSYLDAITNLADLEAIRQHAERNGYTLDTSSYQEGMIPVVRDEAGRVVRVFATEGVLKFERREARIKGQAVNIRPTPSTKENPIGRLESRTEALRVMTEEEYKRLLQEGKLSYINPEETKREGGMMLYENEGRSWVLAWHGEQVAWVARDLVEIQTITDGAMIAERRIKDPYQRYEYIIVQHPSQMSEQELQRISQIANQVDFKGRFTSGIEFVIKSTDGRAITWNIVTNVPGIRIDAETTNFPLLLDVIETLGQRDPDRTNVTRIIAGVLYVERFTFSNRRDRVGQIVNDEKMYNMTRFAGNTQVDIVEVVPRVIESYEKRYYIPLTQLVWPTTYFQLFNGGFIGPGRYIDLSYTVQRKTRERYTNGEDNWWENPRLQAIYRALGVVLD